MVRDVRRVAGERGPAERPLALAEERPDERGHETREVEGVGHAGSLGLGPDVVAVVERHGAGGLEGQHRADVIGHRGHRTPDVLVRIAAPQVRRAGHRDPRRNVAVQGVVGGSLVRDDVESLASPDQLGLHLRGVADQGDGFRAPGGRRLARPAEGFIQGVCEAVHVADLEPSRRPGLVHLDDQGHSAVHGHGQRLGAAHPAQARGKGHATAQRSAEMLARQLGECLVGALEDPLRTDVYPRSGRHLAVHRQAGPLELPERLPVGPLADEVRVGDQDARRPFVSPEDTDRLARLDQQRLVVLQATQLANDRVEGGPAPGGSAGAAVDDQVLRAFGHLGIQVVHEHAQGGLLGPTLAGSLGTAWCADGPGSGPGGGCLDHRRNLRTSARAPLGRPDSSVRRFGRGVMRCSAGGPAI